MNVTPRQNFRHLFAAITISIINATSQVLLFYYVLKKFGDQFNDYIRITTIFSALMVTSESALGIATIILLVNSLQTNDWITTNEIYSSAKRNYRKSSLIQLSIGLIISLIYPIFINFKGLSSFTQISSWEFRIVDKNDQVIDYWQLVLIAFIYSSKNFLNTWFFAADENVLAADNNSFVKKIIILFAEVLFISITLLLINLNIKPIVAFLPIVLIAPTKCILMRFYIMKKYVWLKYKPKTINLRLNTMSNQIAKSYTGTFLLMSTDIIIVLIVFGTKISSALSIYMILAFNFQFTMLNFITSFRDYFTKIIVQKGRIYWSTYQRYEVYSYIIGAITFVNLAIITPFLATSLFPNVLITRDQKEEQAKTIYEAIKFIFSNNLFSFGIGFVSLLVILCESKYSLIESKGRNVVVSKFLNVLGIVYFATVFIISFLIDSLLNSKTNNVIIVGLLFLYIWKSMFLLIKLSYLSFYCYRYITYDSSLKNVILNIIPLVAVIVITGIVLKVFDDKDININNWILEGNAKVLNLLKLIGITIATSIFGTIFLTCITSYTTFIHLIKKIPIVSKIISKKTNEKISDLEKEFSENIDLNSKKFMFFSTDVDGLTFNFVVDDSISKEKLVYDLVPED